MSSSPVTPGQILNLRKSGGVAPEGAVRIDRKTRWGNPFPMSNRSEAERNRVVAAYRQHLWQQIRSGAVRIPDLAELHGKDLACWCAPALCHGNVLREAAAWANGQMQAPSSAEASPFGAR